MTINGAIMELVMLCEHPMMPNFFKPSIQKVIETISEAELVEPTYEADTPQTETQNSNKNSNVISVYDGVSEAVRCAMCSNPNKSDRGCDGACSYDEKLYERIMKAIAESVADTPQTDLVNDSQVLAKDLVDDEFNPYDEECMKCKHLKLKCEFVPSYCKFELRDTPQTERQRLEGKRWTDALTTEEQKCLLDAYDIGMTPQTDCGWGKPNE